MHGRLEGRIRDKQGSVKIVLVLGKPREDRVTNSILRLWLFRFFYWLRFIFNPLIFLIFLSLTVGASSAAGLFVFRLLASQFQRLQFFFKGGGLKYWQIGRTYFLNGPLYDHGFYYQDILFFFLIWIVGGTKNFAFSFHFGYWIVMSKCD